MNPFVKSSLLVKATEAVVHADVSGNAGGSTHSILVPGRPLLHEFIEEIVQLVNADTGHHHNVGYVPLAGKLPPSDKLHILWPFKHYRAAELIKHRSDSCLLKAIFQVVCISQALLDFLLKASVAFPVEGIPEEDRSMAVPASHDCRIPRRQVLHIARERVYVLQSCYLDSTWHGASNKLVSRDADTPNRLLKCYFRCL
uniref:Uncharacterized protein n=1 Tax=Arundo donax TaxID=35708 RepID=A0A0A9CVS6_ARUDO